ncbi:DNA-3-methyladenine glycosylase 2 family protein [Pseudomonas capeferrum]|uniref:DNA-3-methyladenine glycosylase family protein n=1 Tax=Pseudomonas capeferrum TaxID=1495066 RepID=UPI0015E2D77C|nr:DNA-3-methyladenine glycosylase [Pseudomonas capeferrum]MBA1204606.1 DNA-3-methyladenine glycosylase 2 family protein [Pseudomonas capeferrum]
MIQADLSLEAYGNASRFLETLDSDWARHIATIGPCLHRATPGREPYEALVRAIAYQQLHARAAEAILGRMLGLYPDVDFPSPEQLLALDPQALRACGFSANKLATIRGIAQARLQGTVPTREEALALHDDALIERLVVLPGVGRWTVEMLLIYCLERSDILPVDDFAVREGYRRIKGFEKAPTPAQMRALAGPWSPHRTVASWYLWRA